MLEKNTAIALGAASNTIVSSTSWITIAVLGVIMVLVIIAIYRLVMDKKNDSEEVTSKPKVDKVAKVEIPPKVNSEGITPLASKEEDRESDEVIAIPVTGHLIPLSQVPDPIYAEQLKGEGFAVESENGKINSPVKGRVMEIAPTRHALTIESITGRKVLVHFGVEAANLKGEGFICEVKVGQEVEIGTPLLTIDFINVARMIPSTVTSVVFTNLDKYEKVVIKDTGYTEVGTIGLIAIEKELI